MRNTVSFRFPAPLIVLSDDDGVVSVQGAGWFLALVRTIPGLELEPAPVQEDWGVLVGARRAGRRYWIGLSSSGSEHEWIARVSHHSWLQRFRPEGRAALVGELDRALRAANASSLRWFDERDLNLRAPAETPE